uniref:Retrotransposon Copia-like N-terminal domain-containing protein n=1 Tax=Brassica oleracea var. oleracea TaxID=109376 RepID=A0A0D3D9M3_BRAOL
MTNIEKLQFSALKITGENYIGWVTNVKPYLVMKKITETIKIGNKSSLEHIAEAIIFLKKHLDENLTHDYASVEDPAELWQALKERCGCKGHWSRTCRTPPHFCKLYQESTKGKAKEVNLTQKFEGTSYLDASDFANELD